MGSTLYPFAYRVATSSNEGHESHEGGKGHDSNSRLPVRCRDHWLEIEGCEGSHGGLGRGSSRSVEKGWLFQDCRCAQLEAEIETCHTCAQGRQPFHEKAVRFKSQASIQDGEGTSDEKAEAVGELMLRALCGPCLENNLELFWSRWAVSPDLGDVLYFCLAPQSSNHD